MFNNKTQKTNDFFLIVSNYDKKPTRHSLINALKQLNLNHLKKWHNLSFEEFVNEIDAIIFNLGNMRNQDNERLGKYKISKFQEEYSKLQRIRFEKKNSNDIAIIIANPWASNYMNQDKWKQFEDTFINKYKLPIVHYSTCDVINRSSMTRAQWIEQRAQGTHYCIPGATIKYAFTFFEMIEMLTIQMQLP